MNTFGDYISNLVLYNKCKAVYNVDTCILETHIDMNSAYVYRLSRNESMNCTL